MARLIFLIILLAAAAGIAADHRAALERGASLAAIRAGEAGTLGRPTATAAGQPGIVDKFCGFAPCGMPLPCE
ncbi:MAG: hypothetical protein KA106_04020 [Ferrovibrio sp.]|nr:hypothetical protein [Ferrovibrio sp.]